MTRRMKIILISAASAIGIAGAAAGLSAATSSGWEHAGYGKHGRHHGMHMVCNQGQDRLEDVVTFAEIRLSITDAQKPQWEAFANAVRDGGAQLLTACDRMDALHQGPAPARFAEVEKIMEDALAATKSIRSAFDPLYTVLDDDQKATVERLTTHPRHRGQHHEDRGPMQKDG